MSQHKVLPTSLHPMMHRLLLIALVVSTAISVCGCQVMESMDYKKCMIPPNHPHEFEAPINYGYFPTLWRPWPGAEAGPGHSLSRNKDDQQPERAEQDAETLPPPSDETTPDDALAPGMDVFDMPEGDAAPRLDEPGDATKPAAEEPAAPDTTLPDELIPPQDAPAEDALPEELIPSEDTPPAKAPPESGAWNVESLPNDAPEGSLIPEESETAGGKVPPPGLLMPNEEKRPHLAPPQRIENARRPTPVRGASAAEPVRPLLRSSQNDKKLRDMMSHVPAVEGPQLIGTPSRLPAPASTPATTVGVSTEPASEIKTASVNSSEPVTRATPVTTAISRPTTQTVAAREGFAKWQAAGSTEQGEQAAAEALPAEQAAAAPTEWQASDGSQVERNTSSPTAATTTWRRRMTHGHYVTVQTGHTESSSTPARRNMAKPAERTVEQTSVRAANPLR